MIFGSVWNPNYGWINLNPSNAGVSNNSEGQLSGYAWGESTGFIDFSHTIIDENGIFTGYASSSVLGTINFDGAYRPQTDWRPYRVRDTNLPTTATTTPAEMAQPLDLPNSGMILAPITMRNTTTGAWVYIDSNTSAENENGDTYTLTIGLPENKIESELPTPLPSSLNFRQGLEITTQADSVVFDKNITLSIPLPGNESSNIKVYYLDTTNNQYRLAGDGGTVASDKQSITVSVNHLTLFVAVGVSTPISQNNTSAPGPSIMTAPYDYFISRPLIPNSTQKNIQREITTSSCADYLNPSLILSQTKKNDQVHVKKLQNFLNKYEHENLLVNGKFDRKTYDAVVRYQLKNKQTILYPSKLLKGTGTVGGATILQINQDVCEQSKPSCVIYIDPDKILNYGQKNNPDSIKKVQTFLKENENEKNIPTTGVFDNATRKAIIRYQEKYRSIILTPGGYTRGTGNVGKATAQLINAQYCRLKK